MPRMQTKAKALRAAFPHTLPILAGFLFLGFAYGVTARSRGLPVWLPTVTSLCVFAGSMEFVTMTLLTSAFNPLYALLLTLMVNARHLFYGVSMLEKYKGLGAKRFYLIFGLTDETFSILCSAEPPADVDRGRFMLSVTMLNQIYWVTGATLGGVLGGVIPFDTTGIDFVMTALFVVIFIEQWRGQKSHAPALIGLFGSAACLLIFGPGSFLLPAMAVILLALSAFRKPLARGVNA